MKLLPFDENLLKFYQNIGKILCPIELKDTFEEFISIFLVFYQ